MWVESPFLFIEHAGNSIPEVRCSNGYPVPEVNIVNTFECKHYFETSCLFCWSTLVYNFGYLPYKYCKIIIIQLLVSSATIRSKLLQLFAPGWTLWCWSKLDICNSGCWRLWGHTCMLWWTCAMTEDIWWWMGHILWWTC